MSIREGRLRAAVPWLAAAAVVLYGGWSMLPRGGPEETGPARAVGLPGGGVSAGDHCGEKGYHHFPLPAAATSPAPRPADPRAPGPRLALGSYGYEKLSARTPGRFTVSLLFAPGAKGAPKPSRTLGGEGVAVEIEGPHGLVAGAHGLPVTWASPARPDDAGQTPLDPGGGAAAEVSLPLAALCPGHDPETVMERLLAPIDSSNTITGQPAYTLTVSLRGPDGDLLSAGNLVPLDP
ncbi:hypothetical protein ACWDUC_11980 [Streptomyces tricolor]